MAYALKVKSLYRNDQTGREVPLPAIFTESGLLISHLRYLSERRSKSASWKDRSVFAVLLLLRYINANQGLFSQTTELLRSFTQALTEGTINPSTLEDPSSLYWKPRRLDDARALLGHLTSYTDWLADRANHKRERANPFRKAKSTEQRLNWCAYYQKQARVFLNHLADKQEASKNAALIRGIQSSDVPVISTPSVKRFPESEIRNLLEQGFIRSYTNESMHETTRVDYKNQAITLLMHFGGVRKSEVFQLYLSDIVVDRERSEAIVRIYHPSDGTPPESRYHTRREYLEREFQLRPRTEYLKSERLHCGWKAPLLSDPSGYFQVHFFPPEIATEFLLCWSNYLRYQRVDPPSSTPHPYAFTNSYGNPETLKNFQRLHCAAVRRIGLEHKKYFGTTEHGHRHAYGYRLAEHGFNQVGIQKAMHHKSPDSCLVYIQPSDPELREKMNKVYSYGS